MGEIHQLVMRHGRQKAKALVPAADRHLVDLAASLLTEEEQEIGITYSGFCLTALPHSKLADDQPWEKQGGRVSLLIEPGRLKQREGYRQFGVPYGSRARIILLYLQTQALRQNSQEVELGRSMNAWFDRLGISVGGESFNAVREQINRIAACKLTFSWGQDEDRLGGFQKADIIKSGFHAPTLGFGDGRQENLWVDHVRLSDDFFKALCEHPVPISAEAIRQIQNKSMAIDVYIWLAYRLHSLDAKTRVSWAALYGQFGAGFKEIRQFRAKFIPVLKTALAVYPEAKVDLEPGAVILHPSPPAISPRRSITA